MKQKLKIKLQKLDEKLQTMRYLKGEVATNQKNDVKDY